MPKRRDPADNHPFRQTSSGFESLIPRGSSEDFFFSQLLKDPEQAVEFFEHGEDRDPLLGDPRVGMVVSGFAHVFLVLFMLFEPSVAELLNLQSEPEPQRAEVRATVPLVFMAEPLASQATPVPAAPLAPAPDAQPEPPPPQPKENALLIPKAMLEAQQRAEIMNDLPFSTGNTDEFYTKEEVKDPGEKGDPGEDVEPEAVVAEESGEDDATSSEVDGADDGNDAVQTADDRPEAKDLPDFLFRNSALDPTQQPLREQAQRARIIPPEPAVAGGEGAGGEDGRLTDIRRFLAGSQFHNPEGGLVVNSGNTMYYNDQGANFVPWIRRMLTEVGRTWRAGMPWAASIYRGHVAIQFAVDRSGTVTGYQTVFPSNIAGFDNIAVGAIRAADLLPLPDDYPDDQFEIILVFWYNERPYDLFGG
jgi:TonB family protein